MGMKYW